MKEVRYVIKDEMGIHARPAGLLVRVTSKFNSIIRIKKGSAIVDAKSILGIMGLGTKKGEEIVITCDGPDEGEASETIKAFLEKTL